MTPLLLLLRRVPWMVWAVLGGLTLLGVGGSVLYHRGLTAGRNQEALRALTVKQTRDSVQVVRYDTLVLHDTVRLTRTLARYDTVRSTLNIRDTVAVAMYVKQADAAIAVCRETVAAFALSCAAKDTVISDLRATLALRLPDAPRLSWKARAGYALAGAVLAEVVRTRLH